MSIAVVSWVPFQVEQSLLEGLSETVASVAELDTLLDRIAATLPDGEPVLVNVQRANGDHLAIGIGAPNLYPDDEDYEPPVPITVLTFVAADHNPPYYNSLAAEPFPGELQFFFSGSDSEFGGDAAVPLTDAREAIRRFVQRDDGLPDNVAWQEV